MSTGRNQARCRNNDGRFFSLSIRSWRHMLVEGGSALCSKVPLSVVERLVERFASSSTIEVQFWSNLFNCCFVSELLRIYESHVLADSHSPFSQSTVTSLLRVVIDGMTQQHDVSSDAILKLLMKFFSAPKFVRIIIFKIAEQIPSFLHFFYCKVFYVLQTVTRQRFDGSYADSDQQVRASHSNRLPTSTMSIRWKPN